MRSTKSEVVIILLVAILGTFLVSGNGQVKNETTQQPVEMATPTPTATPYWVFLPFATNEPTSTPVPTATPVPTFTPIPTIPPYYVQATATPVPTASPVPTATPKHNNRPIYIWPGSNAVPTASPVPTATPQPTIPPHFLYPTATPVVTASPATTSTPTPMPTAQLAPTPTVAPTSQPVYNLSKLENELRKMRTGTNDIKINRTAEKTYDFNRIVQVGGNVNQRELFNILSEAYVNAIGYRMDIKEFGSGTGLNSFVTAMNSAICHNCGRIIINTSLDNRERLQRIMNEVTEDELVSMNKAMLDFLDIHTRVSPHGEHERVVLVCNCTN